MKEIKALLEKYYKAESSLEEESSIKAYFLSNNLVNPELENDKALFIALHEETQIASNKSIASFLGLNKEEKTDSQETSDSLLDKYFAAETSLEEERNLIEAEFSTEEEALFVAIQEERNQKSSLDKDKFLKLIQQESKDKPSTKVVSIQKLIKYAAILVIPIAMVFSIKFLNMANPDKSMVFNSSKTMDIEDPEEAYRMAKEALMFAGSQMKKGQTQLKQTMPLFEKTKIFK